MLIRLESWMARHLRQTARTARLFRLVHHTSSSTRSSSSSGSSGHPAPSERVLNVESMRVCEP